MSGNQKPRILLCHASEDKPQVTELYHQLKDAGYSPWLDKFDLLPGQDWWTEIEKIIRDVDNLVVVCLSEKSTTKRGVVQREIKRALDVLDKMPEDVIYLIPVRLEYCLVPDRLSNLHWVNLFEPDGFENLKRALDYEISKRQAEATPEPAVSLRERIFNWDHKESLYGIYLVGTGLPGIKLPGADLRASNFSKSNLFGANLREAKLIGAKLVETKLQWANLQNTDLSGADLSKANLSKAHMKRAKLIGANVERAVLKGVTLTEADLSALDLGETDLNGVSMDGAILRDADLSRVNLTGANLENARYTDQTKWPKGFDPAAAGAILED